METQRFEKAQSEGATSTDGPERIAGANEMPIARILDAEFATMVGNPERFRELFGMRPLVAKLEAARHEVDGQTIYEHTRQLLLSLRTDEFQDVRLGDAKVSIPDLLRVVGLYHDAEKALMTPQLGGEAGWRKPSLKEAKSAALEMAYSELSVHQPELLVDPRIRFIFNELMMNGFYFGYNLDLLKHGERRFDDDGEALLEKVLHQPTARLRGHGLEVEPDTLFSLQFALSRADSSAIGPYKKNLPALELLRAKLLDLIN